MKQRTVHVMQQDPRGGCSPGAPVVWCGARTSWYHVIKNRQVDGDGCPKYQGNVCPKCLKARAAK